MEPRRHSQFDRLLGQINRSVNTLGERSVAQRGYPPDDAVVERSPPSQAFPADHFADTELKTAERRESARLMRVNHAGEVAAQALYEGQAFTARSPLVADAMRQAAQEEKDHLAWCQQRLGELGARASLLNPFWYSGSFALGALAGAFGDDTSLGFIVETERQVEAHLHDHLRRIPQADARSRLILEHMQIDEARHGAEAAARGGKPLPEWVQKAMRLTAQLMTRVSYWV